MPDELRKEYYFGDEPRREPSPARKISGLRNNGIFRSLALSKMY